jgi:hypothetical protein
MPRAAGLLLTFLLAMLMGARARAEVATDRAALYAQYAAKLNSLAAEVPGDERAAAQAAFEAWLPKRSGDQLTLFVPPSVMWPAAEASDSAPSPAWQTSWQKLRDEQANALFALARQALAEKRAATAFELVVEALRENSDHEPARKALGYVRFRDAWHTPYEIRQLRAGKVWHARFGWLPQAHLARYEAGERFALGRWMTAAEENNLRADIGRGWRVETEHYVITTNHSLEEGVALAQRLEGLVGIWQQVFPAYLASDADIARRLDGRSTPQTPRQHEVVYYRSRDEYNQALRAAQPKIDITLGIYFDDARKAYFFAGDEQAQGTVYHEATHQLFQETRRAAPHVGREANFWVVEGIACYMESLAEQDGYFTLGGENAGRMPAARHRLLNDGFYVPLDELVQLGMHDLQRDQRIAMLYSQSAGLCDFLMHDGQGRYRDALAQYLAAVYAGRATPATLAESTGASYEALDGQYRAFMSSTASTTPEQARAQASP